MRWFLMSVILMAGITGMAEDFLLPNGDFRYSGGSRWQLERWRPAGSGGGNRIEAVFPAGIGQPGRVELVQDGAQPVLIYQDFFLLPGLYEVEAEIEVVKGSARIQAGDLQVTADADTPGIRRVSGRLEVGAAGMQRIHLGTGAPGSQVTFHRVGLTIRELAASGHPQFRAIRLPEKPTPAQRFAAWELQRLLWRMNGCFPGVAGRDPIGGSGPEIRLDGAADPEFVRLSAPLRNDGFNYGMDAAGNLNLCGNSGRGTLYAVYDFFTRQGCLWAAPGEDGEIIPVRTSLSLDFPRTVREPLYAVRGLMNDMSRFRLDGGWELEDYDALFDWALRNGWNAMWMASDRTLDFRDWRGGSVLQTLNHSWHLFLLDDHPEWFPQVGGERRKLHISGRPNQLCLSNPELQRYVADYIIDFFRRHPDYRTFGLSAEDEPCFWCECAECRKLDPDGGAGPWRAAPDGTPEIGMADRSLAFVNRVAGLVAEEFPDRFIEMYAYSSLTRPPVRQQVASNVIIKYCYWPEIQWPAVPDRSRSLAAPDNVSPELAGMLAGWKTAGASHLALYDYDNYLNPDTLWGALRWSFESVAMFGREFGFEAYMPESHQVIPGNPLLPYLRRAALWGAGAEEFDSLVATFCTRYFGVAGEPMTEYYRELDRRFRAGYERVRSGDPGLKSAKLIDCPELTWADLEFLGAILDRAWKAAADDPAVRRRLAGVALAHDLTMLTLGANSVDPDAGERERAAAAFEHARKLVDEYGLTLQPMGLEQLKFFYLPPSPGREVQKLPERWRFRPDPDTQGELGHWQAESHPDWAPISIAMDWTSQGFDFHGTGWYEVEFDVAQSVPDAALYFGAVDGVVDVYWDGVWVGEQKLDPGRMWNRPFRIDLPAVAAGSHRLTLKVTKEFAAAGVWRPVALVAVK